MVGSISGASSYMSVFYNGPVTPVAKAAAVKGHEQDPQVKAMKRSGQIECETCKNRKYQDGSDEMVSFKSAAHISPQSSGSRVRAHEQEHVNNAYAKASKENGEVLQASVSLHTSICPECGRSYVAGGTTTTQIRYNEDNPYGKNQKSQDLSALLGQNIDYVA